MGVNNPAIAPVRNPMTSDLDVGSFDLTGFELLKGLRDEDGNELIAFQPVGPTAVNFLLVSNAGTGNAVNITAAGDDADIDLNLNTSGTGLVNIEGNYSLPGADGSPRHYLRTDGAGTVFFGRGEALVLPLFDPSAGTNYIETPDTSYENIAQFVYSGSAVAGTITSALAVIWTNDVLQAASIKIIDETNGNDICEITGITSTSTTNLAFFPSFSDIPAAAAVFSINILTASATRRARVSNVLFNF